MIRVSRIALAGLALVALGACGVLAALRAAYPFELEWQEGGVLAHVERIADGEPLYAAPSLEFIAFPYTPLLYVVGAAVSAVIGPGFLALRLVSIAASIAVFVLLHRIAARHAGTPLAGLLAAGLFAATYRFAGAWLDVARVDSLSLALTLAGLAWIDGRRGARHAALAGAVLFLAFFAKQSALVPAAGCIAGLVLRSRREALACAATLALLLGASTLVMDARSDGWYRWYVFELLAGHPLAPGMVLGFAREILLVLAPAIALAVWSTWRARAAPNTRGAAERSAPERFDSAPFLGGLAGLVVAAWLGRAHVGGYDNTLLPACAAAALVFGPALARLVAAGGAVTAVATALGVLQFARLAYDPRAQVPTERDRQAGEALVASLRAVPGEVWIPDHGYLALRAGKGPSAHGMAMIDLLRSSDHATAQRFVDAFVQAIEQRRYGAIVLDEPWEEDLPLLSQHYRRELLGGATDGTFLPVTGDPRRPRWKHTPREAH